MENDIENSRDKRFPGTEGNPFDIALRKLAQVEDLSSWAFALILLVLALPALPHGNLAVLGLWAFFLLDWALLAALPRYGRSYGPAKPVVLLLAVARAAVAVLPLPFWLEAAAQITGTLLVLYGFWIEPHRLTLTRQTLATSKLPSGTRLRLLHLGDLHMERITQRDRHLNRMVSDLKPDVIVFSGDFLNLSYLRDPKAWEDARAIVGEWAAPLGVYAVTGSPAVDLQDVIPTLLRGLPLRWLDDERITLTVGAGQVDILGITCTHKPFLDAPRLEQLVDGRNENFSVLLYHSPDLAPEASAAGIDLQLSGHTHGGQVRLPFFGAFFAASMYGKRFEAGRYSLNQMTLYVTRGIGLEGQGAPRVRFLCPPEIILWDIEGKS
ncbi:MAG TPA: metallophosphoesterase [Anaerolineaceae bacterium]